MPFLRKVLTETEIDNMRIFLSARVMKLGPEPRCDFCGEESTVYCYAASRTSTGRYIPCWRWCSCEDCAEAIEGNNWDKLENKIVDWLQTRLTYPRKALKQAAHTIFQEFICYAVRIS